MIFKILAIGAGADRVVCLLASTAAPVALAAA